MEEHFEVLIPDNSVEHGFKNFDHGAADIILAMAYNSSGTRLASGSADHRIRVYDLKQNDDWILIDQWRGHDAEILDVHWVGSSLGQVFGTIGGDNKFKLWREDPSSISNSGRRFKCIFSQSPSNHVPYASFGLKTVKHEVWLALITRDGLLSLLEPAEPEALSVWKELDSLYPFEQHPRGTEPKFKLSIHQSERPCYNAILAGLDAKALSLAASAFNLVKVFRAVKPDEGNYQLYEVAELFIATTLINDVAWAPGCIRPHDLIATACDDGTARVFKVVTPHDENTPFPPGLESPINPSINLKEHVSYARKNPSGIGAGLAGASRAAGAARHIMTNSHVKHEWMEISVLPHDNELPVWKIEWMYDGLSSGSSLRESMLIGALQGSALASTGDSGKLHLWKQNLDGEFIEFAQAEIT